MFRFNDIERKSHGHFAHDGVALNVIESTKTTIIYLTAAKDCKGETIEGKIDAVENANNRTLLSCGSCGRTLPVAEAARNVKKASRSPSP